MSEKTVEWKKRFKETDAYWADPAVHVVSLSRDDAGVEFVTRMKELSLLECACHGESGREEQTSCPRSVRKTYVVLWEIHRLHRDPNRPATQRAPYFVAPTAGAGSSITDDIDVSNPVAFGSLKWDGCCDMDLDAHTCGPREFRALARAIGRIYEECDKLMAWAADL